MGVLVGLICACTWAVGSVMCKRLSTKLDPITLNAPRALVGGVSMLLLALVTGRTSAYAAVTPTKLVFLLGSILVGGGLGDSLYLASLARIGVSRAFPISSTYPALTLLFGLAFLSESIGITVILGLVLVIGGIMLVSRRSKADIGEATPHDNLGVSLAVLSAIFWGASSVMVAPGMEGLDPISVASFRTPALAIFLFAVAGARGTLPALKTLDRGDWALLIVGGLIGWGLGSVLFLLSVTLLGPTRAAIITSTSPLFALPLSTIFLKERLNRSTVAGTLLTVTGVILVA